MIKKNNVIYYGYYIEKEILKINNELLKEGLKIYKHFNWDKAIILKTERYYWDGKTKDYKKTKAELRHFEMKSDKKQLKNI